MEAQDVFWKKVGHQIHILVPGSFAGALAVALAAYCEPAKTKEWVDAIGAVLAVPVLILLGVSIHLTYRVILGEWFLYPIRDLIRWLLDWSLETAKKTAAGDISFTRLLQVHGVPFGFRRVTYSTIRGIDGVLEEQLRARLDVLHATYAFFYLSAVEFAVATEYCIVTGAKAWQPLAVVAGIMLGCAFGADLRQDIWECRLIRRDPVALKRFLATLGFKG